MDCLSTLWRLLIFIDFREFPLMVLLLLLLLLLILMDVHWCSMILICFRLCFCMFAVELMTFDAVCLMPVICGLGPSRGVCATWTCRSPRW